MFPHPACRFCPASPVRRLGAQDTHTATMNDEDKVLDIHKKIEREKALIQAANLMRQRTNNETVIAKLDTQIHDGRRNLEFFEERLRELQMRRVGQGMENMSLGTGSSSANRPKSSEFDDDGPPPPPPKDRSSYGDRSPHDLGQAGRMPSHHPFPSQPPNSTMPKPRPNFTKLGAFLRCRMASPPSC